MKYQHMQNRQLARWALALIVAAMPAIAAQADGVGIRTVTLTVKGSPMVFNLNEKPVITFSDNQLHITTETEEATQDVDVDVTEVSVVEFKGAPDRADANGDNAITAADINVVVNHIVGKKEAEEALEPWGADANGDNKIDAADLTEIIKQVTNQ